MNPRITVDVELDAQPLVAAERQVLQAALNHAKGCVALAARLAGIGRTTLYRKVAELDLTIPRGES